MTKRAGMYSKRFLPTPAQRELLKLLAGNDGRYCTHFAIYGSGFSVAIKAATVRAVDRAGWIEPMPLSAGCFQITPLGRDALQQMNLT